jgi:hypothetical protein
VRIVTHGGQAHADEVMAIALIMICEGKDPAPRPVGLNDLEARRHDVDIVRTTEEKRAKEFEADYVVDVGRDHDPRKNWFDHHQFPREASAACAFTLVARKFKVDLAPFPWAEKMAVMDSKGPKEWFRRVARRDPADYSEIRRMEGDSFFSYLASMANRNFRGAVRMAMDFLASEFRDAEETRAAIADCMKRLKVVDVGAGARMAYFDSVNPRGTLAATDRLVADDPSIIVTGMRDERGGGYGAVRIMDNERVDFSPREEEDGCIFAHKTGFCLKWRNDWDEFVGAVARSIRAEKEQE